MSARPKEMEKEVENEGGKKRKESSWLRAFRIEFRDAGPGKVYVVTKKGITSTKRRITYFRPTRGHGGQQHL